MGWGRPGIGALALTAGLVLASMTPASGQSAGTPGPAAPATSVPPAVQPSPISSFPQGSWAKTAGLKTARSFHSATLLADGKVLVAGGCDKYDVDPASFPQVKSCIGVTAATEVYDPARATWSPAAPMKTARMSHSTTLLPDGRVLVAGGCTAPEAASISIPNGPYGCKKATADSEVYDPATGRWTATAALKVSRTGHAATLIPSGPASACGPNCGRVFLVGNSLDVVNGHAGVAPELYNPAKGIWAEASMPPENLFLGFVTCCIPATQLLKDGKVLVVGFAGRSAIFSPDKSTWVETANDPLNRAVTSATALKDGRMLVSGGFSDLDAPAESVAEIFDPTVGADSPESQKRGSWTPAGQMGIGRAAHASTLLMNGQVLVAGGTGLDREWLKSASADPAQVVQSPVLGKATEVFDPQTSRWAPAGEMTEGRGTPSARNSLPGNFSSTLLKDGRVLVAGGDSLISINKRQPLVLQDKRALNTAEIYTPAGWTPPAQLAQRSGAQGRKGSITVPMVGAGAFILIVGAGLLILRRKRA